MRTGVETAQGVPTEAPGAVRRAFEELFRDYHSLIVTAAFNRLSDLHDAEEVAAEVFTAAWRRRADPVTVFTLPWLYATLRNVVGNEYRRRERAKRRESRIRTVSLDPPVLPVDEEAVALRRIMSAMRSEDRELLWMVHWEDLTHEEIAAILRCTQAAVKVRLSRARGRLRALLDHHGWNEQRGAGP